MTVFNSMYRFRSRGPFFDPPLQLGNRVIVGPGVWLTPTFVANNNITHIINVSILDATPAWARNTFRNRFNLIECQDSVTFDIFAKFPEFDRVLTSYLHDPICGKVYVHCQAGMNRSATLAIAYFIRNYGISLGTILNTSIRQRPCILMNTAFNEKLVEFAKNQAV